MNNPIDFFTKYGDNFTLENVNSIKSKLEPNMEQTFNRAKFKLKQADNILKKIEANVDSIDLGFKFCICLKHFEKFDSISTFCLLAYIRESLKVINQNHAENEINYNLQLESFEIDNTDCNCLNISIMTVGRTN